MKPFALFLYLTFVNVKVQKNVESLQDFLWLVAELIVINYEGVARYVVIPLNSVCQVGVDISHHRSKHVKEVIDIPFNTVITVCDDARENCPVFPRPVKRIHKSFDDPPILAKSAKREEEVLDIYRRVRDEIREFVNILPESVE